MQNKFYLGTDTLKTSKYGHAISHQSASNCLYLVEHIEMPTQKKKCKRCFSKKVKCLWVWNARFKQIRNQESTFKISMFVISFALSLSNLSICTNLSVYRLTMSWNISYLPAWNFPSNELYIYIYESWSKLNAFQLNLEYVHMCSGMHTSRML